MPFRHLLLVAIFLALVGCGKPAPTLPVKPQILPDRVKIQFGQEYGSGTYIGTSAQESILIQNQGQNTLVLQVPTLVGDPEITMDPPASLEVKGNDHTFIRLFFAPKLEKVYSATLTISSNAENTPQMLIDVSGKGVKPLTDGGTDGG